MVGRDLDRGRLGRADDIGGAGPHRGEARRHPGEDALEKAGPPWDFGPLPLDGGPGIMTDEMRNDGHLPATKADLNAFATKTDLNVFATRTDLNAFATKADMADLATKLDMNFATKADLSAFATKADMKAEFAAFRSEIHDLFRPIAITLAHHTAELADIRGHIKEKMVTRDEFHSRMDGFAGRVADFDYSSAKNRARLDEHEERIRALENKNA
ncbi:MAG: hypothetical protein NDJ72_09450 [Elusimicrobia bacterium]|nr:hypothetical protein [Elusimicrobiota bacterium]